MRESVIGSSRAMSGLQTGPHWCESVAPSLVTLEQRGGRQGTPKAQGVMVISRVELQRAVRRLEGLGSQSHRLRLLVCSQWEPLFLQGTSACAHPAPQSHHPPHRHTPGKRRIRTNCCLQFSHQETLVSYINTHTHTQTSADKETIMSQPKFKLNNN